MDERTHWCTQLPAKFVGEWNASSMDNVRHSCTAATLVAVFNNMQSQMKSEIFGKGFFIRDWAKRGIPRPGM